MCGTSWTFNIIQQIELLTSNYTFCLYVQNKSTDVEDIIGSLLLKKKQNKTYNSQWNSLIPTRIETKKKPKLKLTNGNQTLFLNCGSTESFKKNWTVTCFWWLSVCKTAVGQRKHYRRSSPPPPPLSPPPRKLDPSSPACRSVWTWERLQVYGEFFLGSHSE